MMHRNRMHILTCLLIHFTICDYAIGRENGVGRTPPMGWMSWTRFACNVNCDADPEYCISERLIVQMADRMVEDGYLDAGWDHLVIDDCWASKSRDDNGYLQPDPARFPHGIRWLSDYVHQRGLKFGIYAGYGEKTCMGYPGTQKFVVKDISKFVEWQVDYLKLDACYSDPRYHEIGFSQFGSHLMEATRFSSNGSRKSGRPIYFSCSYPFYMLLHGLNIFHIDVLQETCNSWRIYDDVAMKFESVLSISEFWGVDKLGMSDWAGPGHFNDADMLLLGNEAVTPGEARFQLAIWLIVASPLFLSNDLRRLAYANETRRILLNKELLSIARDPLALAGHRVKNERNLQIWIKRIEPASSFAVAILNCGYRHDKLVLSDFEKEYMNHESHEFLVRFGELGLENEFGYNVTELFSGLHYGVVFSNDYYRFALPRNDAHLYRFVALQEKDVPSDLLQRGRMQQREAHAVQVQAELQRQQEMFLKAAMQRHARVKVNDQAVAQPVATAISDDFTLLWLAVVVVLALLLRCVFPRRFRNCLSRCRLAMLRRL